MPIALDQGDPVFSSPPEDSAAADSDVPLWNPGDQSSPLKFLALDQRGPTSSEDSSSEDSASSDPDPDMPVHIMNSTGWASPTDFATAVAPALFVPLALAQEDQVD